MPQLLEQKEQIHQRPEPPRSTTPPLPPPAVPSTRSRWLWAASAVILAIVVTVAWRMLDKPAAAPFVTATVQRGDVARTISATGKVQAVTTVQVGTQVSGTVSQIFVDYNSPVKKGQIIAQLDQSQLQAQLTQSRAALTSAQVAVSAAQSTLAGAQANVEAAQANVDRLDAAVTDARDNFNRVQQMFNEKLVAARDLEVARNTLNQALAQRAQGAAQLSQAKSQVASTRAQIAQAQAQVAQQQAQVQQAAVALDKTIIRAPIDGVIVARSVDVGQTVAASFNTPTLFLIANDLTRMQVLADIDEADVGQLTQDSKVEFTVDAFPRDTFTGRISQIRLAPQTVQNVTTYTAVVDVSNPDGKLLPGMTANVTATTAESKNVLMVPNAALRFRPAEASAAAPAAAEGAAQRGSTVWRVAEGNRLEPVKVRLGITNGIESEVLSGGLKEGDAVALASTGNGARPQAANNPFTPSRKGGRR